MKNFWRTRKKLVVILLVVIAFLAFGLSRYFFPTDAAQATKRRYPKLRFELVLAKNHYALGEAIPVTMRYFNGGTEPLKVSRVSYDRSGRIADYGFSAESAQGATVRDPFPILVAFGGLRSSEPLPPNQSFRQGAIVNEWLSFDKPGTYKLSAYSTIVSSITKNSSGSDSLYLLSEPTIITVGPPDEAKRKVLLKKAAQELDKAKGRFRQQPFDFREEIRDESLNAPLVSALRDLRWLNDPRAIPLLVKGLEASRRASHEAYRGLASFTDMAPVRPALVQRLKKGPAPAEDNGTYKSLLAIAASSAKNEPFSGVLLPEDEALFRNHTR